MMLCELSSSHTIESNELWYFVTSVCNHCIAGKLAPFTIVLNSLNSLSAVVSCPRYASRIFLIPSTSSHRSTAMYNNDFVATCHIFAITLNSGELAVLYIYANNSSCATSGVFSYNHATRSHTLLSGIFHNTTSIPDPNS